MSTALERLDSVEKKAQETEGRANAALQIAEDVMRQGVETSQGLAAIGKTLTALLSVLTEKSLIKGEEILNGIRRIDENNAKEEISSAVKHGVLSQTDVVGDTSIVVLNQVAVPNQDPTPVTLADYRIVEMGAQLTHPQLKEQLKGKKVGEAMVHTSAEGEIISKVLEIYQINEMQKQGEALSSANS